MRLSRLFPAFGRKSLRNLLTALTFRERLPLTLAITDGLTEVFDTQDREFGIDAVKRVLVDSAHRSLPEIADRVVGAARAFGVQADDQTLLLIRRRR